MANTNATPPTIQSVHQAKTKAGRQILSLALLGSLFLYTLDSLIDAFIFDKASFLDLLLYDVPAFQIYYRLFLALLVWTYAAIVWRGQKHLFILQSALQEETQIHKTALEQSLLAASVFKNANESHLITDAQNQVIDVNDAFIRITGYTRDEIIGHNPSFLQSGEHQPPFYLEMWNSIQTHGTWSGEVLNKKKNGDLFPNWVNISAVYNHAGTLLNYVAVYHDLSFLKNSEEKLRQMAYSDPLTGLPNRTSFTEALSRDISAAKRCKKGLALMYLDLDRFKDVNDTLGHAAGDLLLCEIAKRLSKQLRESDFVARIGGDEFLLILTGITDSHHAGPVAQNILRQIEKPILIQDQEVYVGSSIGIAIYPTDGVEPEDLIKKADMAMYQAKQLGKGQFHFFDHSLEEKVRKRLETDTAIHRGISEQEFELYYQPIIHTPTGELIGAEVLARWRHPRLGLLTPEQFIPFAEETRQILPLGHNILKLAATQNSAWQQLGLKKIPVSVNLSASQFKQVDLVPFITKVIESSGLKAEFLDLELTGSLLFEGLPSTLEHIRRIQELPCKITLDDFGTGYSSLLYLKQFPFKTIKIDRHFITEIENNPLDKSICRAVINLCRELDIQVIAVGIESAHQLNILTELGCTMAQGFYYSKPLPTADFEAYLATHS